MKAESAPSRHDTDVRHRRVVTPLLPPILLAVAVAATVAWVRLTPALPPLRGAPTGAVYTVTYLSNHLAAHSARWVGSVVQVRAVAVVVPVWVTHGTAPSRLMVSLLVGPDGRGSVPLVLGPEDRVLAAIRRRPLIGALAPPPQARVWEMPTVYRAQVEAVRRSGSDGYEAVLVDAGT